MKKLFEVQYSINGSFIVKAEDEREAMNLVESFGIDEILTNVEDTLENGGFEVKDAEEHKWKLEN